MLLIYLLQTYPDLNPKVFNNKEFVPKLYGFKVYGKRGSKYYEKVKEENKKRGQINNNENKILSNVDNEKENKYVDAVMQRFNKLSI